MSVYSATVRHDSTSKTILAYLALYDTAIRSGRIAEYCWLMHEIPHECTRASLMYLLRGKRILRSKHAWYQRLLEFANVG